MPGLALPCVATWMPIVGLDVHKEFPPGPLGPYVPHLVVWWVGGLGLQNTSRAAPAVESPMGSVVARAHDAGPMIVHIPVPPWCALKLPAIMIGSSSRSEFGVSSVHVQQVGGASSAKPIAIAFPGPFGIQLDCNDIPLPLPDVKLLGESIVPDLPGAPTGMSITLLNTTVLAGFTWADFLGSLLAMLYDVLVQWLCNLLANILTALVKSALGKLLKLLEPLLDLVLDAVLDVLIEGILTLLGGPGGTLLGIPVDVIADGLANLLLNTSLEALGELFGGMLGVGIQVGVVGGPMGWSGEWTLYAIATGLGLPTGDDVFDSTHAAPQPSGSTDAAALGQDVWGP